jgi:hypothetical protein
VYSTGGDSLAAWLRKLPDSLGTPPDVGWLEDETVHLDCAALAAAGVVARLLMGGRCATVLASDLRHIGAFARLGLQVRQTPSWPRSWANFSHLQLYYHRHAWANLHLLDQPNNLLAAVHGVLRGADDARPGAGARTPARLPLLRRAAGPRGGAVGRREKQIGSLGGSLEPPGPLPMHLHAVYMECSECLPTLR